MKNDEILGAADPMGYARLVPERASPWIPRRILPRLEEALGEARVVVLCGARQAGKTTLAQRLAASRRGTYWTLDDIEARAILNRDPRALLEGPPPVVIDEFQTGGDRLLRAIKMAVDLKPVAGRFLLTGSTRFTTVANLSESLAGRAEIVELWPLTQGEVHGGHDRFVDGLFEPTALLRRKPPLVTRAEAVRRIVSGGYPSVLARPSRSRQRWYRSYVRTVTERDVREISGVQSVASVRRLLAVLAARTAQEFNLAHAARDLDLPRTTVAGYLPLLESLYMAQRLPAWSRNLRQRVAHHPKLHLVDTGLAASLVGADAEALVRPGHPALGPLLETFVAGEIRRQATWSETEVDLFHFRDHNGPEVDLVLEASDGRVAGIEVKASSTVEGRDFRGLDMLHERLADRFVMGVVLHLGERVLSFGDRRVAMPLSALWS
jgi:predicted AAA+ superfamily ATPase